MTASVAGAVAVRDEGPSALVNKYRDDFAAVLPSHVKPDTWVRLATGALRRDPKLAQAAANDPALFLGSLLTAARLGLEPGTEQYYLTPRRQNGRDVILGIVGYQGQIELMYRAGAISSVVAECVYTGDKFTYRPGIDERPQHEIDWDAEDRGALRLVYAYAVMKDGATSKVVVLNKAGIERIKKSSQGAGSQYSPWVQHPDQMWLKSAVRQLQKWVPTSAEYVAEQQRARAAAEHAPIATVADTAGASEHIDPETGEVIVDGELIDDGAPLPPVPYDPTQEPEGWR